MSELVTVFSFVMNVFLLFAVLALVGERRSLSDQVRWLQQQVEQLQRELERERGVVYGSGDSSRLLPIMVLAAAAIVLLLFLTRAK